MIKYFILAFFIISCSKPRPDFTEVVYEMEQEKRIGWSIEPKTTKLNKKKTFYVFGKKLFGTEIITDRSVEVLEKRVLNNGTQLKLELRIKKLNGSSLEERGKRTIRIKTINFSKEFVIKVKNEK